MAVNGLFVGLTTLDLIYRVEAVPQANQKIVASDYALTAGGPATNAAVTFQHLRQIDRATHPTTVLSSVGSHPLAHLLKAELEPWNVAIADLDPDITTPPPTSSILVTRSTGDRSVVSLNATRSQAAADQIPADLREQVQSGEMDVILIDGHQMAVGQAIAQYANAQQTAIVVDAGSWKPNFEAVLSQADYVICSANFHPPGCQTAEETFRYLDHLSVPHLAITRGNQSILYRAGGCAEEIPVPAIAAIDTLGAGDVFHGAFCYFILQFGFADALANAAAIAARSCQSFGTRSWMQNG